MIVRIEKEEDYLIFHNLMTKPLKELCMIMLWRTEMYLRTM